jgi:hypothetical protein
MTDAATTPRVLAEVRGRDDLHHALRARAEEVDVSRLVIDQITGMSTGYASKVLAEEPLKGLTIDIAALIAPALGCKILLVEDPETAARMERRWTKRAPGYANVTIGASPAERAGELRREQCRKAGKARARSMSKPERVELARKGGKARSIAHALASQG